VGHRGSACALDPSLRALPLALTALQAGSLQNPWGCDSAGVVDRYYLAACLIATWASIADFAMLSGQGWTVTDGCRQFFYAR
jgi:bacteriorhodopsin